MPPKMLDRWLPTAVLVLVTALITFDGGMRFARIGLPPFWAYQDFQEELAPLLERYGAEQNSRWNEELMIRDFLQDRRDGFFLDVGASHYQQDSNTYYLEKELGWSGIAIEPQTQYAADYTQHRPRTRFVSMFASDVAGRQIKLFTTPNDLRVASSTAGFTEGSGPTTSVDVPTTTLNDVLEQARVGHVDFVSMDIELHEPQALAGFDLVRFEPALVCIEAHPEVRQQILDYFHERGYVVVGKYLRSDVKNLYFTPARQRAQP